MTRTAWLAVALLLAPAPAQGEDSPPQPAAAAPEPPALVGSCEAVAEISACIEHRGPAYESLTLAEGEPCVGDEGRWTAVACPTEGRVGGCARGTAAATQITFLYSRGAVPKTPELARQLCRGEWVE